MNVYLVFIIIIINYCLSPVVIYKCVVFAPNVLSLFCYLFLIEFSLNVFYYYYLLYDLNNFFVEISGIHGIIFNLIILMLK